MEYYYQCSVDDFSVEYTLGIPEKESDGVNLSKEQMFLRELEEAYDENKRLTNDADNYDYALAVSSGIIAGLIDSLFVGEWNFAKAKKKSNIELNNMIIEFAKKDPRYIPWCENPGKNGRRKLRDPNRLASAVEFLEEKYPLPGDGEWNFENSGVTPNTHRLDDFCHHPTVVGMICCILVQFTGEIKYHRADGKEFIMPVTINEYGNFVSDSFYGKIFAGIINWFFTASKTLANRKGHLISDIAGSLTSVKKKHAGAGIPGTVMSTLKELSILPCIKNTSFAENLRKAYQNGIGGKKSQLNLGLFNKLFEGANSKFDMRTEMAVKYEFRRQSIPVIINEIIVRAFYFIRRFIEQAKETKSLLDIEWKNLIPANNRTIVRMMTVASTVFCIVDLGDAVIRSGIESYGNASTLADIIILRVNFVGIGRFTVAVGTELYMDARGERLEMAIAKGEVALAAVEGKKAILETSADNRKTTSKIDKMKYTMSIMNGLKI